MIYNILFLAYVSMVLLLFNIYFYSFPSSSIKISYDLKKKKKAIFKLYFFFCKNKLCYLYR